MLRTQLIEAPARHNTHATCTIGLSYDEDIKLRSRRRWKKGHVYIHSAKSVSEPLTRLPCLCSNICIPLRDHNITPPFEKACPQALFNSAVLRRERPILPVLIKATIQRRV